MVYTRRAVNRGIPAMRQAFWRRSVVIYLCQAASLLFLFTIIAALGLKFHQPAANNLMWFYLEQPFTAFWASLILVYNPPLLDILPVYIIYMLFSPWVLGYALQNGWRLVIGASVVLWAAAQFGLSELLYGWLVAATGLPVPFSLTGAFETYAWQLLWVMGLWLGARHARQPAGAGFTIPRWLVRGALLVVLVFFIWRHLAGIEPFAAGDPLNLWWDKWHLGPMRLLNFLALATLVLHYGPWLRSHLPRVRWLEILGSASLPVFCAHLVFVLLMLALVGESSPDRPLWFDPAMLVVCVAVLYEVARLARRLNSGPGGGSPATRQPSVAPPTRQGSGPSRLARGGRGALALGAGRIALLR